VRLLFQGYFEADRNLEALIGAMEHLRGRATLTLQGWGGIEADLRRLADSLDLDGHVFFVPACGPSEVVKSARKYDVGIVCHRGSTLNHDIAAPNKLMDYIGAGLAVAGSNLPGIRSVIEPEGCGVLIDPASAESIAVDLGAMLSDPEGLARMKAASVRACRRLSWDVQVRKLVGLYLGLLAKGKHGGVAA
jgi:glycosyltransferase involved in cell wall biosynthesis